MVYAQAVILHKCPIKGATMQGKWERISVGLHSSRIYELGCMGILYISMYICKVTRAGDAEP